MPQNKNELYERRNFNSPEKKIKHLKIGVILAIIIALIFVSIKAFEESSNSLINYQLQQNWRDYSNERIGYDEYDDRREYLELKRAELIFFTSIASNTAKVCLIIAVTFIIISLLSISFDEFFDKKMRRLSLIITIILLLFVMYSIFVPSQMYYQYF